MRLIDLARPLENTDYADPPGLGPKIAYFAHQETAEQILSFFPSVTRDGLPGGEGWAVEQVTLSTHNGTHLDAPYHYHSTMDGGQRAITIDEVPLEWCMGRGVKLDFRAMPDGHVVTPDEVAAEFDRIGHQLEPGDIVLVNTAAAACYGTPQYVPSGCGIGRAACRAGAGAWLGAGQPDRQMALGIACAGTCRHHDAACRALCPARR